MHRPAKKPFRLTLDSILREVYSEQYVHQWAEYQLETGAPCNSAESEDDYNLYQTDESEEAEALEGGAKKAKKGDQKDKDTGFNLQLLDPSPFALDSVRTFPHKFREGDIPLRLLKVPKIEFIIDSQMIIQNAQKGDGEWDLEFLQTVLEYYCKEMKAAPISLADFINSSDPKNVKLSIKNYHLDQPTAKALACVIPFMTRIHELELHNNQLQDAMGAIFALAFFMNPCLKRISVGYNYMRQAFNRTLSKLICAQPHKITHLNTMGSVTFSDHLEPLARCTPSLRNLEALNVAGCGLSQKACATIARLVLSSRTLLELDVSHCKISFQGTRYIIDALNRNLCVRNFNFSHNDLQSETFEFSIKVASMITRHPSLAHLNIAHTNLKREEMVFIGLSLSTSKVLVSLHLSGATLPYYERVFLRSVIAARVGFKFKSLAHKKDIHGLQERN